MAEAPFEYALARQVSWEDYLGPEPGALVRNYLSSAEEWHAFLSDAPLCMVLAVRRTLNEAWVAVVHAGSACPVNVRSVKNAHDSLCGIEIISESGPTACFRPHAQGAYAVPVLAEAEAPASPQTSKLNVESLQQLFRELEEEMSTETPAALPRMREHLQACVARLAGGHYDGQDEQLVSEINYAFLSEAPEGAAREAFNALRAKVVTHVRLLGRRDTCPHCGAAPDDALAYPCPAMHEQFAARTARICGIMESKLAARRPILGECAGVLGSVVCG